VADNRTIPFTQDAGGLHLRLPSHPIGSDAYVYRITFSTPHSLKAAP
jgi:alpha-L-fucosidase